MSQRELLPSEEPGSHSPSRGLQRPPPSSLSPGASRAPGGLHPTWAFPVDCLAPGLAWSARAQAVLPELE